MGSFVDIKHECLTGDIACTLTANTCQSATHAGPSVLVLNDQGGSIMSVGDKPGTLREQMKHHEPIVCYALDHVITTGAQTSAQGSCVYKDICPTEKAGGVHAVCYEVKDGEREVPESVGPTEQETVHD